ncbi:MAG: hypothetical protein M1816_003259 [Peltula sp. TS41687]|nr:MAG: hypothetical protein M1816_003259 [Peltula sp. TS41687]
MALNYIPDAHVVTEDGQPPRKKPRKGTHSCLECKRRKVRCTFPSGGQSVCVGCTVRKSACISQEYESVPLPHQTRRENVRDRIGRLEALVEQLQGMVETQGSAVDENQKSAAQALENMSLGLMTPATTPSESAIELSAQLEHAPLISLFDNAVLSLKDDDDSYHSSSVRDESEIQKMSSVDNVIGQDSGNNGNLCQALLSSLPPEKAMASIFSLGGSWWSFWQEILPVISNEDQQMSLQQYVAYAIRQRQPVLLAHILLCVAICVQELPSDYDYGSLSLPVPAGKLMQHYVSVVQRLVTWDDELVGNLNGLGVLLLQGKCHINLGQPRKAWLLSRRAISLAQHLGLHRTSARSRGTRSTVRRNRRIWWTIYEYDRYMSMLLGLPYSVRDSHIGFFDDDELQDTAARYWRKLTVICGHVVDLTQASHPPTFAATCGIDQELEQLAKTVPEDWWEIDSGESFGPKILLKRLIAQFAHHYVRAMLHMPFMLHAMTEQRYEQSRQICLNSARDIIKRYHILRNDVYAGSYVCPVVDFQSFTATVMLLLDLLGHTKSLSTQDSKQAEYDWAMVDSMIDLIRRASKQPSSIVATQALKVLEALRVGKDRGADLWDGRSVTLVIPYFGAITIGPGSQLWPVGSDHLEKEDQSPSEATLQVETVSNVTPSTPSFPLGYASDEPLISFSSLLGPASSPSHIPWPSQEYMDSLLRDPNGFDLDHEWSWIWKDDVIS